MCGLPHLFLFLIIELACVRFEFETPDLGCLSGNCVVDLLLIIVRLICWQYLSACLADCGVAVTAGKYG